MTQHYYVDLAATTTLSLPISNSSTTMTVGSTTGFPASFPYYLALDYGTGNLEVVEVTAASGLVLTMNRGVSGTVALAHSTGAAIVHVAPAQFYNDTSLHTNSNAGVHGVVGSVVGTTDAQTLTNKTISGASNTLSAIPESAVTNLTSDLAGKQTASTGLTAMSTLLNTTPAVGILVQTGQNTVGETSLAAGSSKVTITNSTGVSGGVAAQPTIDVVPTNIMAGLQSPAPTVVTGTAANGGTPGTGTTTTYAAPSPMPKYLRISGCNSGAGGGGSTGGTSTGSAGGGACGAASAYKTISTSGLTFPLQVVAPGGSAGGTAANGGNGVQATVKDNNGAGSTLWSPGVPAANGVGHSDGTHAGANFGGNSGYDPTTTGAVADYVIYGQPGENGFLVSATVGAGGQGGSSHFGGGGVQGSFIPQAGNNAAGYGGGGGGSGSTTTNATGGGGGGSIVIIEPIY